VKTWCTSAFLATSAVLCFAQADWTEARRIDFLKKAEVTSTRGAPDGITGTTRATLSDGVVTHDASIQTIDITPLQRRSTSPPEPLFSDRYAYNIAAYELSEMLGLHMIPTTVERTFQRENASFTWWVDDVLMTERERYVKKQPAPDQAAWNNQVFIVRVFDQLIYNTDRNIGNLVIDKRWRLWMIDHSRSFRVWETIKDKSQLVKCDRRLLARLRTLDLAELHTRLDPYIMKEQVEAVKARADLIVKFFDEAIKKKGEAAVLYDYLPAKQHGEAGREP
jgi:hypothetical protein